MLGHVLRRSRAWLIAHGDDTPESTAADDYLRLVEQRAGGMPIAYMTGRREFYSLDLEVSTATLIPRPETELLVDWTLEIFADAGHGPDIADLGTGSGAIALAIASQRPSARIVATDVSTAALEVAGRNLAAAGIRNVQLECGNWFEPLGEAHFDAIVSNPPYVTDAEMSELPCDVLAEPAQALRAGPDGLDAIRTLACNGFEFLRPGGFLLIEHGALQGPAVRETLSQAGFQAIETRQDLAGQERATIGYRCV
jgi:release factor glutamine methyltransferase